MRRLVALLLVGLVGGCAIGGGVAPTSTLANPVSSLPQGSAVPTTRVEATTVAPGTASEPPFPPPSGEVLGPGEGFPPVLVAGPDGVLVLADNRDPDVLVDGSADNAVEDTMGGVLFQRPTVEPELSVVWWIPAGTAAPQQLLVPSSGHRLVLSGVAESETGVDIWYTRRVGDSPEDMSQTLRRYSLTTGTVTEVAEVGGWEASMRVSVTPSLLVGELGGGGLAWFSLF